MRGLDKLEEGIARLFPERTLNLAGLFAQVMEGDIPGAIAGLFRGGIADIEGQLNGIQAICTLTSALQAFGTQASRTLTSGQSFLPLLFGRDNSVRDYKKLCICSMTAKRMGSPANITVSFPNTSICPATA